MTTEMGFDVLNWPEEAAAAISDIKGHVREIFISSVIAPTELEIYINCETFEAKKYTIRLSNDGYQIVSDSYDKIDNLDGFSYETPYALLNKLSPGYINSFGNELSRALSNLQKSGE